MIEKEEKNIEKNIDLEQNLLEKKDNKKKFKIFGFSIWRLLAYFIIYSIIGYFIETLFCIAKYGVWESRQSFLYGPFCAIYGLGAVVIIVALQYFKKSYNRLFLGGCIVGSVLEYLISWIGEIIFNVKWWDYSELPLNLNGRICLLYAVFWGGLSLYLMVSLNPKVDNMINWLKPKLKIGIWKVVVIVIIIGMIVDYIITAYALTCFMVRIVKDYNIDVANKQEMDELYEHLYSDEAKSNFIYKHFGDEKMLKTFPRLKIENSQHEMLYFSEFLNDIQPYYYKVWSGDLE